MSGGDGNRTDEIDLRFLKAAVEAAGNAILITTACLDESDPKIVYVNPAFTRLSGYEEPKVQGRSPRFLQAGSSEYASWPIELPYRGSRSLGASMDAAVALNVRYWGADEAS